MNENLTLSNLHSWTQETLISDPRNVKGYDIQYLRDKHSAVFEFQLSDRQKNLCTACLSVLFNWNGAKLVIEDSFRFNILTSIFRTECTSYELYAHRDKYLVKSIRRHAYPNVQLFCCVVAYGETCIMATQTDSQPKVSFCRTILWERRYFNTNYLMKFWR